MNRLHELLPQAREQFPLLDLRDQWLDQGIVVLKPANHPPDGSQLSEFGALNQSAEIAAAIYPLAELLGIKTAFWDTVTADAHRSLRELATSRYADSKNDAGRISINSGGKLRRMAQPTLPQIGLNQNWFRDNVRSVVLENPTCNLFIAAHETVGMKSGGKDGDGNRIEFPTFIGPDVGGRASAEQWGKDFTSIQRIKVEGDKRIIHLNSEADKRGIPCGARTGMADGSDLKQAVIPKGLAGCVKLHRNLFEMQGFDPLNPERYGWITNTTYGLQSCGKTWWLLSMLAIPGMLPALYIASDGGSEHLRVCPKEIREQVWEDQDG